MANFKIKLIIDYVFLILFITLIFIAVGYFGIIGLHPKNQGFMFMNYSIMLFVCFWHAFFVAILITNLISDLNYYD